MQSVYILTKEGMSLSFNLRLNILFGRSQIHSLVGGGGVGGGGYSGFQGMGRCKGFLGGLKFTISGFGGGGGYNNTCKPEMYLTTMVLHSRKRKSKQAC